VGLGDRADRPKPDLNSGDLCPRDAVCSGGRGLYCGISGRNVTGEWNRLIYFARIDRILTGTDYYLNPSYWDRLDNVYRDLKSGRALHLDPKYANYPPSDYFDSDIGSTGLLTDARILLSQTFVYLGAKGRNDYITGDLKRWILGDSKTKTKPWGMGHKRLLRDAAIYPGAYGIFLNHFEKMVKEFGYGYVGVPSNLAGYLEYLSDRGISRRVYEK
jgi:hypothetical protein